MKRFIVKVTLFAVAVVTATNATALLVPRYCANALFQRKLDYFADHQREFNAVAFGSSRTYRHINPVVFDAELRDLDIRTFNFATPAAFNPESYYQLDRFLDSVSKGDPRVALLELQEFHPVTRVNMLTPRSYYYCDAGTVAYAIQYAIHADVSLKRKAKILGGYVVSWGLRLLNVQVFKDLTQGSCRQDDDGGFVRAAGFYALDDELASASGDRDLAVRRRELLANPASVAKRQQIATTSLAGGARARDFNDAHYQRVLHLIDKADKKGVRLLLVVPPRLTRYRELLAITQRLPQDRVVAIVDPGLYPELYALESSFDVAHLNAAGAAAYSRHLAREVRARIATSPPR
jgi:hypothetical protein